MNNFSNCPNCGHPAQPDDKFCRNCGIPFKDRTPELERFSDAPPLIPTPPIPPIPPIPPGPDTAPPPPPEDKHVPWEEREKYGFFGGLWETWKESIVNPDKFFLHLPHSGGMGSPILYAVIIGFIYFTAKTIYGLIWTSISLPFAEHFLSRFSDMSYLHLSPYLSLLAIPLSPIYIVIALFVISGIYHLIGKISGWASRDFEATLRAVAYSIGPYAFALIPFCGLAIAPIWSIILMMIGYKHLQQTSTGKAVVTVLLPLLLCCCLMVIIIVIFGTALLGFLGAANKFDIY